MPSLLASAAMAALAGSGGRKLSTDVTACTHDICGRKLLKRDTTHGNPVVDTKYNSEKGLYLNAHTFAGLQAGTVQVVDGKIKVSVDFDHNYVHDHRKCKLIVTPSIVEGTDPITDKETATDVTSKTFNPPSKTVGTGDDAVTTTYAAVSKKESGGVYDATKTTETQCDQAGPGHYWDDSAAEGEKCEVRTQPTQVADGYANTDCILFNQHQQKQDGSRECYKLTVELDDPALDDRSLGYLSVDLGIKLACYNQNNNYEEKGLFVSSTAAYSTHDVRVRHKFVEHDSDNLSILPGAINVDEEAQWGSKEPKFLPVKISANVRAQTETGKVRFPTADGGWGTFGKSEVDISFKKLSCEINQGATKDGLGDATMSAVAKTAILGKWYDAYTVTKKTAVMSSKYGAGHDIVNTDTDSTKCPGEEVGVACGRYHDAAVDATSANGLGFELPLDKYYETNDKPRVKCIENQGSESKEIDIDLSDGAIDTIEYKTDAQAADQAACEDFAGYTYDDTAEANKKCSFTPYRIGAASATVSTGLDISAGGLSTILYKTDAEAADQAACEAFSAGDLSYVWDGGAGANKKCSAEDFGETFFGAADEKHIFTNGGESIFAVQLDTPAPFRDLTTKYDHSFDVSYVNAGTGAVYKTDADAGDKDTCEAFAGYTYDSTAGADKKCFTMSGAGASSEDVGYVATLGSTLAALPANGETSVTNTLTEKLNTMKSQTMVQRPTLYGQTRATYKIKGAINGADVHFRRDEAAIDLNLAIVGTNAGKAKYSGDEATAFNSDDVVQFPGASEDWQDNLAPPTIITGGCVYCADDDGDERTDVALETDGVPTPTGTGTEADPWQFYKEAADITTALFDTTVGVWDATALACVVDPGTCTDNQYTEQSTCESNDESWTIDTKARAHCKSAQAASGTAGYLCQKQSVTFGLEVSKDSLDNRKQGQKITVPRIYEGAEPAAIEAPTIEPRATTTAGHVEYIKSGAKYAASFDKQPTEYVDAADQPACESENNVGFTWDAGADEGKKCAKESDLVASDGTHNTAGLTFGRQASDAGAKAYNCDAVPTDVVYQADYNAICDGAASKIDYKVKTSVIYEKNQVKPSAVALQAGSSGVAANKITEYALQREGVDVTFEITKSTEAGSLQYDSTSRLKVDHAQVGIASYDTAQDTKSKCDAAGKTWDDHAESAKQCFEKTGTVTLIVVAAAEGAEGAEGYCLLQSPADGKADSMLCTLKGFQDPAYDPGHVLSNDISCVTSAPEGLCVNGDSTTQTNEADCTGTWTASEVACPSFQLTAQQEFFVPHLDTAGNFFEGAAQSGDTCGGSQNARLHDLDDLADFSTVTLEIAGSDKLYSGSVELFWFSGSDYAKFASVIADSTITSTGATSEYASTISMAESITAGTTLPQVMSDLKMQIKLFKEDGETDAKYRIVNKGAEDYDLYFCPQAAANFVGCDRQAMISDNLAAANSNTFITMTGSEASMFVQIAARDESGSSVTVVDPCFNKMLGADVYPNGIKFSVEKAVDPTAETLVWGVAHTFTVPIKCHTATSTPALAFREAADIDSQTENPYSNGKSWNQKNLEVVVSGSTIDPDVPIKVLPLSNTLISSTIDGISLAAQAFIDKETRVAVAELKFVTDLSVCSTGTVEVTIAGQLSPITKEIHCPSHEFVADGITNGALIEPTDSSVGGARYGDVFMVPLQFLGRDELLWGKKMALRKSTGADEKVVFFTGENGAREDGYTVPLSGNAESATLLPIPEKAQNNGPANVLFQIIPNGNNAISCNEIELEFSSMTTQPSNADTPATPKKFSFRIKCPRQTDTSVATDKLVLNYNVAGFLYNHENLDITLSKDVLDGQISTGATSVAALGQCVGTEILKTDDTCKLNTQEDGGSYKTEFSGGERGLDLFTHCAVAESGDGTSWDADSEGYIVSRATVARRYTKAGVGAFAADDFCGETPLLIKVQKSQTKYIAISVSQSANAEFDVQVSELAWVEGGDGHTCDADEYRLEATVEMKYRLAIGSSYSAWTNGVGGSDGAIQSYFRQQSPAPAQGLAEYFSYEGVTGNAITAEEHTVDAGHTMKMYGPCTTLGDTDDSEKTVAFRIKVFKDETEYFSAASVTVRADAPKKEEQQLDFAATATTALVECALDGAAFIGSCADTAAIPSTNNVRLTVGVDESSATSEGQVFSHLYTEPRIKKSSGDKCGLFKALKISDLDHTGTELASDGSDCQTGYDINQPNSDCQPLCELVKAIGNDGKNYVAQVAGSDVDLVGSKDSYFGVSQANRVVTLRLLPLAGNTGVTVGWTISRENTGDGEAPGSRRLRSVQHVAYTLGADGAVSKSTSFGVLPAVRDSDGVSAVTTKEQFTQHHFDADGNVIGEPYVYNQTTVELEKTGEDHTLAVLGIVFGGLGSVAAIAVAFFVGCASRKDARGAGSSFSTVTGGYSDRQPLFNRNRFAPSDF